MYQKKCGNIKYIDDVDFSDTKIDKWKLALMSASGKGGINRFNNLIYN